MASLRNLLDCKAIDTSDKNDVFNHLKDVKTKENDADIATLKLHQKLAPARQLIDLVDQAHPMPGDSNQQQQYDEQGNPIQNDQLTPGQQTNPASPAQANNQAMQKKPMMNKPVAGKPSTAKKPAPKAVAGKSSAGGSKDTKSKKGFEVHIRGEEGEIDQLNVKKGKKRYDYHENSGQGSGAGRGIGVNGNKYKR